METLLVLADFCVYQDSTSPVKTATNKKLQVRKMSKLFPECDRQPFGPTLFVRFAEMLIVQCFLEFMLSEESQRKRKGFDKVHFFGVCLVFCWGGGLEGLGSGPNSSSPSSFC